MTQQEATQDVQNAKAAGFDAFALNTHTITDQWALDALGYLFQAADQNSFSLFMSFDTSWGLIHPADIPAFLATYSTHSSYYKVNGKPFVSTFWGGKSYSNSQWDSDFRQTLSSRYGIVPFFVPDFDDWPGYPNNFVNTFPVIDGAFSWETAWPAPGNTPTNVSSSTDQNVLNQAHGAGKVYMMPLSSNQFKYQLASGSAWYRIGEVNMPQRMEQILTLQPDLVEVLTWNDAGESHYVGNIFPEAISGSPDIQAYSNGFDHTGWQQIISPFIKAYRDDGATDISMIRPPGSTPVGTLWYRTQMTSATCTDAQFQNHGQAVDAVNFAVILPAAGYTIRVYSNNALIGTYAASVGLYYQSVPGLQPGGGQRIEVYDGNNNMVSSATGTKSVASGSPQCNWNYEVVGLSG
ncbi:Glucan endo-1,3-alpha-glucosidase [Tolypocladium capitatum]|uniref:Glucan endo-1,3-alpha-glucosidase n=1 Tax=Tolypocladium capitatum TaxID=45235 RepID=A0A2K3QFK8_9HYPO|nr:Glucan endo-1,3-alpha-glucosidase [Tolypocladium capitatum]